MDLNTRLDIVADSVLREYQFMLSSFVADFARMIDTDSPTSPAARHALEARLWDDTQSFFSTFTPLLRDSVTSLVTDALEASRARLNRTKRQVLDDLLQDELSAIGMQVVGINFIDSAAVMKQLHHIAIQVGFRTMRSGIGQVTALIQAKRGRVSQLQFLQADRSGRRWSSGLYLRALVRQFLLKVYIESFMYGRVSVGSDLVKVVYSDPEHDNNGLVMSISGATEGYPRYVDIEDEIFHPNSSASVEAA